MSLMTRQNKAKPIPSSFLKLQKELFMLRPIRSKSHYRQALAIAADLASRENLTREQADYLQVLSSNIKTYEDERLKTRKYSPLEILKHLVSENSMSGSELGRVLGHRTLGPKLLNGERQLSKEHINKLSDYFSVEPGLFLG